MNVDQLEDKYLNCAEFAHLVNLIERLMTENQLTPQDVRDAGFIAGLRIAQRKPAMFGLTKES